MKLDEIQDRINRLAALVNDPQPGHASWCEMLGQGMEQLIAAWQGTDAGSGKAAARKLDQKLADLYGQCPLLQRDDGVHAWNSAINVARKVVFEAGYENAEGK